MRPVLPLQDEADAGFGSLAMRITAGAPRTRTQWLAVAAAVLCGIAVASNVGKVSIMIAPLRDASA